MITILTIVTAWFIQENHNKRIELGRQADSALHSVETRMTGALARGTDPRRLAESCAGIDGVTCESNGDTVTMPFFPDESREKPYESRRWRVNGHTLQFIGLAD